MIGIIARLRCWILLAAALLAIPVASYSQIAFGISVNIAPPELPYYEQPPCPDEGYIWTPGYWAYGDDDYYWVPGTWVLAPRPGYLWTPAYWGWAGDGYNFHSGYWGEHIGFYGGIDYGYGYFGNGYDGGYWDRGVFNYNTAVTNVNTTVITNIYNQTVVNNNTTVNNISYNGGAGGTAAQPTAAQLVATRERHVEPTNLQVNHEIAAKTNPSQYLKVNAGTPIVAATLKPGLFQGRGVVAAAKVGRLPQNATNSANANAVDTRSGNPNTMIRTATNARSDRPPSAQRPAVNNGNRTNLTNLGAARNNSSLFDNRTPATSAASARGDRPPSANRPTINGANGLNSTSARNLDRPTSAQHNVANPTIPSGRDGRGFQVATHLASPQRNDRPNTATNRLPLPQYNNHANLGQRNERVTSPQHSDQSQGIYSNSPNSRRSPSVPSNPGTMNRQSPPQQQSPPRYQNLPPQRQSTPPQSYNAPPQHQSAPPQRYNPPPQRQSAPPQRYNPPPQQRQSAPPQRYNPPQQQRQSAPPQRYNPPPQHQSAPAQRYNPPPQRQSAPPQSYNPPPQRQSAPQSTNHPATPSSHQH